MIPVPETTGDFDKPEQTSEDTVDIDDPKQQAIEDVAAIDDPLMNAFRDLLFRYIDDYSTDISEISAGLLLSRPVVTEFMNRKNGRNQLPLSPGRICNLHAELTKPEKLDSKRRRTKSSESIKKTRTRSQEARNQLKEAGADELLMTAGFQPQKLKMVPVSPLQYSQLSFISFLYGERPLSQDVFSQITKQEVDRIEIDRKPSSHEKPLSLKENSGKSTEDILLNKLSENTWINQNIKDEVSEKYRRAIQSMSKGRLTPAETTGLFKSILNNQLNKEEEFDLNLTVIGVERTSLSLPWVIKESMKLNASDLLSEIHEIGKDCEDILKNLYIEDDSNKDQKEDALELKDSIYPVYPITKTVVNCKYGDSQIKFECVSRGTHVNTASSAITQNMGLRHSISSTKMDMIWLGEDIRSLIDTVVTIGVKDSEKLVSGELVSGEWVSSDLFQSLLQATIIAGNKWFHKNFAAIVSISEYKNVISKTAKLRASFYEKRLAFDEYDFDDSIIDVDEFRKINDEAEENIKYLESRSVINQENALNPWDTFLYTFRRISILSQIYRLHHYNVQINHSECYRLIGEIQDKIGNESELDGNNFLISAKISLSVEKIAYNLSFGIPYFNELIAEPIEGTIEDLLKQNLLERGYKHFDKMDEVIEKEIKECIQKDNSNNPGYDIHHSLGSYHSIIGRVLLYVGKDKKDLDSAFDRFLKAAYYFQRIGLSRKVQRSITLAGLVKVRAREEKYVEQCEELSRYLLEESVTRLNMLDDETFLSSIKSRLNLLQGEHSLIIKGKKKEGLIFCLKALKGGLWLGLNRHIVDSLHAISLCTEDLYDREIKEDLLTVFPELWKETGKTGKAGLIRPKGDNKIAKRVVRELINNRVLLDQSPAGESACWNITTEELKIFSASVWNTWYQSATGDEKGEHPFGIEIREGRFMKPI